MKTTTHWTWACILGGLLAIGCGDDMGDDGGLDDGAIAEDGAVDRDAGPGGGSCSDMIQNQDETDVDCGGTCGATCRPGEMCSDGGDCTTGDCTGGTCGAAASCSDGRMNGTESDVDCGGPMCMACPDGRMCGDGTDCMSMVCTGGTCTAPVCGDGVVNIVIEECDGDGMGTGGETATCDADCTLVVCGDDTINASAGETCEEGGVESATCDSDCTAVMCGDGTVNTTAGEACDGDGMGTGGESATCDADCTLAECGDGAINATAGETCDDMGESATCDSDCTAPMCGDGVLNVAAGEECDDGNTMDGDRCSASCVAPPDLTIAGNQRFDTTNGQLDGVVHPGWDGMRNVLVVGDFVVPAGSNLLVFGANPFIVEASANVDVAGNILAGGEDGGSASGAGGCNGIGGIGGRPGPGGSPGGNGGDGVPFGGMPGVGDTLDGAPGMGPGAGGAGLVDAAGGGGAGHDGAGADGVLAPPSVGGTFGAGGMSYNGVSPLQGGSGGGGGSADDDGTVGINAGDDGGGAGGGGGGAVRFDALNLVTVSGNVDVRGGDGGNACFNESGGGGGGSGGTIVIASGGGAPVLSGNLLIAGGAGGNAGGDGGDGAIGRIFIDGTCTDGRVNQDESDVDCGGAICGACADGLSCVADGDCSSMTCQLGTCVPATCTDGMVNAGETDVDCGGPSCLPCSGGQMCTAGTDCVSGMCDMGTCSQEGHIVLIGHDYLTSNTDMDILIGNATLLTSEAADIDVLVYTQFADLTPEVPNTENAIRATLAPFRTATFTRFDDFAMLAANLTPATDVLLIPEQEAAAATATLMRSIGTTWQSDLTNFLARGGVVIVCSGPTDDAHQILDSAGLLTVTGNVSRNGDTVNVVAPTDPIANAVSATYNGNTQTVAFTGLVGGTTVAQITAGEPVAVHRVFGGP